MTLEIFKQQLQAQPESIIFSDVIALIDALYDFTPTAFTNGKMCNEIGQNNGSCKLFSFAKLIHLSEQETLTCFGDYYRKDVLLHPDGTDHQNIRNFMQYGWNGVNFEGIALTPKIQ